MDEVKENQYPPPMHRSDCSIYLIRLPIYLSLDARLDHLFERCDPAPIKWKSHLHQLHFEISSLVSTVSPPHHICLSLLSVAPGQDDLVAWCKPVRHVSAVRPPSDPTRFIKDSRKRETASPSCRSISNFDNLKTHHQYPVHGSNGPTPSVK